ncbi:MAG TPA: alpha/beta fold hydrolase [Acidobacteriota bacterium]|nr:alpha/beta fold hydrolase [Acidobacteriota bacterium]
MAHDADLITKTFVAPGGTVRYFRAVAPGRREALFIHGLGVDKSWFAVHHARYRLNFAGWVVPDLPGHGESDHPADPAAFDMEAMAAALAELLDAEGIREIVLVGHSMGGAVALALAQQLRNSGAARVAGLVLAEGNLDANDAFLSARVAAQSREDFSVCGWDALLAELAAQRGMAGYLRTLRRAGPDTLHGCSVSLVAMSRAEVTVPLVEAVDTPRLFVFGARNRGRFTSEALARRLGPVAFVPRAGHAMYVDNPAGFWSVIRAFLAGL